MSQYWNLSLQEPVRPAQGLLCFLITDVITSNLIRRQKLHVAERRYGSISSLSFGTRYVLVHDRSCFAPCHPQPVCTQAKRKFTSVPGNPAPLFQPHLYRSINSLLTWSCLGTLQGFLGANSGQRLLASSWLTVLLSAWNNSASKRLISMKFDIWVIFEICLQYSNCIKISQDYQVLYMKTGVRLWLYLTELMWLYLTELLWLYLTELLWLYLTELFL